MPTATRRRATFQALPVLRVTRANAGRSLQEIADACEITKQALSLIERGERGTNPWLADRLAGELGTTRDVCFAQADG